MQCGPWTGLRCVCWGEHPWRLRWAEKKEAGEESEEEAQEETDGGKRCFSACFQDGGNPAASAYMDENVAETAIAVDPLHDVAPVRMMQALQGTLGALQERAACIVKNKETGLGTTLTFGDDGVVTAFSPEPPPELAEGLAEHGLVVDENVLIVVGMIIGKGDSAKEIPGEGGTYVLQEGDDVYFDIVRTLRTKHSRVLFK